MDNQPMADSHFELGTDGPRNMLVGVDGSDTSLHALAYAVGLARRQGAHLIVLYVRPTAAMSAQVPATAGAVAQTQDEITTELQRTVDEGIARLGIAIEFLTRNGNPYKELIAVARELRVDAIVVGASTQAGHKLVGSLAGRLVKDAEWPVTVVP
jgi:nucleotide-binding universal stress UspA family protein